MRVFISAKDDVERMVQNHAITHIISLLDPDDFFWFDSVKHIPRLLLSCEDVLDDDAKNAPSIDQVKNLLSFAAALPADAKVLVHCFGGVSRSTAAAAAIITQKLILSDHTDPVAKAMQIVMTLRPMACPNPVISRLADHLLNFNGDLHTACEAVANAKMLTFFD